jgi:hypothetical protein
MLCCAQSTCAGGSFASVEDLDDARVTDRARCARLIEEAANELGVLREKWAQNLYGDTALKVRVLRKVDFPEGALANHAHDAIVSEKSSRLQRHGLLRRPEHYAQRRTEATLTKIPTQRAGVELAQIPWTVGLSDSRTITQVGFRLVRGLVVVVGVDPLLVVVRRRSSRPTPRRPG